MFPRRITRRTKPSDVRLDLNNPIAQKFDFYIPLGDKEGKDLVDGLSPVETGTSPVTETRGMVKDFTGTAYLNYGDVHDLGAGSITVGCWFRTATNGAQTFVNKAASDDVAGRWALNVGGGGNIQFFFDDGPSNYIPGITMVYGDNQWHFVVGVIDRVDQEVVLYLDGNQVSTVSYTGTTDHQTNFITVFGLFNNAAGTGVGTSQQFDGQMSDCFICHEVLNEAEIDSLYNDFYQVLEKRPQLLPLTTGAAPTGRIMGSLANNGGLAYKGGIAGIGGGLAG